MIPDLTSISGSPWDVLPVGQHPATFAEVASRFAFNPYRRALFHGLVEAGVNLQLAGCKRVFLDGSFVSAKPQPGDYDGCWDPSGVDIKKLDPVFLNFENKRKAQKEKFKGEWFPAGLLNAPRQTFVELFQVDRFTGKPKGILIVDLHSISLLAQGNAS